MNTESKTPSEEPLVNSRQLRKFVIYPFLAVLGAWFCYLWLGPAFYGLTVKQTRNREIEPLLKQAKAGGLTYEIALAGPTGLDGKPVFWCIRNRSEYDVTVEGKGDRRLVVSNYPAMPIFMGSKHAACTPMLLILEKSAPGSTVKVFFKDAPEAP